MSHSFILVKLSLIAVSLSVLTCGKAPVPVSVPEHLATVDVEKENTSLLFAKSMSNAQYCFYEKTVARSLLPVPPVNQEQKLKIDRTKRSGSKKAKKKVRKLTQSAEFKEKNRKYLAAVSELARDSTLLTERSLDGIDLSMAIMRESKMNNVSSNIGSYTINLPWTFVCLGSAIGSFVGGILLPYAPPLGVAVVSAFGKVFWVSCGTMFATSVLAGIFYSKGVHEALRMSSQTRATDYIYATTPADIEWLRGAFTWMESRDAMKCPAQPDLPVPSLEDEEDETVDPKSGASSR